MRNLNESARGLRELLAQRILVLDGAMGTMLQQRNLNAADFGGAALEGCNENLVRTRPDVVLDIHRKYFEAGAGIWEKDSFARGPIGTPGGGAAAGDGGGRAVHRMGHEGADGNDAGWSDCGSNVGIAAACQAAGVGDELRNGTGVHDRPHSNAKPAYRRICVLLSECGSARRRRKISRNSDDAGGTA